MFMCTEHKIENELVLNGLLGNAFFCNHEHSNIIHRHLKMRSIYFFAEYLISQVHFPTGICKKKKFVVWVLLEGGFFCVCVFFFLFFFWHCRVPCSSVVTMTASSTFTRPTVSLAMATTRYVFHTQVTFRPPFKWSSSLWNGQNEIWLHFIVYC